MTIIRSIFISILFLSQIAFAQRKQEHRGFYFSFGAGPAKGNINGYDSQGYTSVISGTSTELNFQIGAAISRKWIIHAMLDKKLLSGPTINSSQVSNDFSLNESVFGGGATHYTRQNFFVTGNIGTGSFSFSDGRHQVDTKNGFSYIVKAGKEWWIARNTAIGIALTYNETKLTNPTSIGVSEKWNSSRIGILVQATFN